MIASLRGARMLRGAELMEPVLPDWSPKIPRATGLQRTNPSFCGQIERAPQLEVLGAAE